MIMVLFRFCVIVRIVLEWLRLVSILRVVVFKVLLLVGGIVVCFFILIVFVFERGGLVGDMWVLSVVRVVLIKGLFWWDLICLI